MIFQVLSDLRKSFIGPVEDPEIELDSIRSLLKIPCEVIPVRRNNDFSFSPKINVRLFNDDDDIDCKDDGKNNNNNK